MGLGTQRVFKKSTPDGNVTIYVEKRDFVDFYDRAEPIEGIVVVNHAGVGLKKVFASVVATFRFGREEDEILGMTFCRELYLVHEQVYPPPPAPLGKKVTIENIVTNAVLPPVSSERGIETLEEAAEEDEEDEEGVGDDATTSQHGAKEKEELEGTGSEETKEAGGDLLDVPPPTGYGGQKRNSLSERIIKKSGEQAVPFRFQLPDNAPLSVAMQQNAKDTGDSCSVRYFIRCYVAMDENDKPVTSSTVNLAIRKLQYAPLRPPAQLPCATATKDFPLSPGKLFLEATLNKSLYHHGEDIVVTVLVQNYSNKTVKHIKVSVVQVADICMFSTGRWKVNVACIDSNDCCPITSGKTCQRRFTLTPNVNQNRAKYGVFTQGRFNAEDDTLSSTTVIPEKVRAEYFGIIISYHVKVKLYLSTLSPIPPGEVSCLIPFLLMHPDPHSTADAEIGLRCPRTTHDLESGMKEASDSKSSTDDVAFENVARVRMRSMSLVG